MLYPLGTYWTGVAFFIFLFAPILPNGLVSLLSGTTAGNFLLLSLVLASSRVSLGATLATFLAVAVLYIEYRQRVLAKVISVTPSSTAQPAAVKVNQVAEDEGDGLMFPSMNSKMPPETISGSSSKEAAFYKASGLVY